MRTGVIIVAAGSGSRMGTEVPKQFLPLCGRPILMRSVEKFAAALANAQIVVVLPESEITRWGDLCQEYQMSVKHGVCPGGNNRFESVQSGLAMLHDDVDLIAVHDGVRCLLSESMILNSVAVAQQCASAIPVVEVVDSIRMVSEHESKAVVRSELRAVQTPQIFEAQMLKNAYKQNYNEKFTDDASVVESYGARVTLCAGEQYNIKITTPLDMIIAESILINIYGNQI